MFFLGTAGCTADDSEVQYQELYGKWILNGTCACNQGSPVFEFTDIESSWFVEFLSNDSFILNEDSNRSGTYTIEKESQGLLHGVLNFSEGNSVRFNASVDSFQLIVSYEIGDEGLTFRYLKETN